MQTTLKDRKTRAKRKEMTRWVILAQEPACRAGIAQRQILRLSDPHPPAGGSDLQTFRLSDLPTFRPSDLPTFRLSDLPTFRPSDPLSLLEQVPEQPLRLFTPVLTHG